MHRGQYGRLPGQRHLHAFGTVHKGGLGMQSHNTERMRKIRRMWIPWALQPANGFCMADKEADCKESIVACERMGECTLGHGHCIATRQKDCEESANCIDLGLCTLEGERCIAGP